MRLLLKIFLVALTFIGVERLCHRATDGFAMVNVYPPKDDNSHWATDEPLELTSETFRYFDSGSQSYVFISDDGQTVLKLFKFQHMRVPPWLEVFPILKEKKAKKRKVLAKTFNSISIAYDLFKAESGLLFIHLAKTDHLKKRITLIDKIGKSHTLDLDEVPFLLQKKGDLAYAAIDRWMELGEIEKAKSGIKKLLLLALSRCEKGIFDKDPDFKTNFGFIGETPFQIDFGRFTLDPDEKSPTIHNPEMIRITRDFNVWIEENHPDLLTCFENELTAILE